MKVLDLLNGMDGAGLTITGNNAELEEGLEILDIHLDTNLVPVTSWEKNSIKNCLLALQDVVNDLINGTMTDDCRYLLEWSDNALKIVNKWSVE